jgi:hypothetical protein
MFQFPESMERKGGGCATHLNTFANADPKAFTALAKNGSNFTIGANDEIAGFEKTNTLETGI